MNYQVQKKSIDVCKNYKVVHKTYNLLLFFFMNYKYVININIVFSFHRNYIINNYNANILTISTGKYFHIIFSIKIDSIIIIYENITIH